MISYHLRRLQGRMCSFSVLYCKSLYSGAITPN
uniref:Uncharacterized protein n=1 Tax=Anguilla anguilla TaxID=7936 RepID=A0A0E9UYU6_ANGAN